METHLGMSNPEKRKSLTPPPRPMQPGQILKNREESELLRASSKMARTKQKHRYQSKSERTKWFWEDKTRLTRKPQVSCDSQIADLEQICIIFVIISYSQHYESNEYYEFYIFQNTILAKQKNYCTLGLNVTKLSLLTFCVTYRLQHLPANITLRKK